MKYASLLLCAALIPCTSISAEPLKAVPASLNPNKAYILVEYKLMPNPMSGFPGSRKYVPLIEGVSFARYDATAEDIRGLGKATGNPVPAKQMATEPFRSRELAKGEGSRLFLIEVEPDLWVVQGWGNTSFSLGSYAFKLEPGTVTDLGVASSAIDWAEGDGPAKTGDVFKAALLGPFAKAPPIAPIRVSFRPRTSTDMVLPAGLPVDHVHPVTFVSGAKFGNYLGGPVNRIEGVNALAKPDAATKVLARPGLWLGDVPLDKANVAEARVGNVGEQAVLNYVLTAEGQEKLRQFSQASLGRQMTVTLDNRPVMATPIHETITSPTGMLTIPRAEVAAITKLFPEPERPH